MRQHAPLVCLVAAAAALSANGPAEDVARQEQTPEQVRTAGIETPMYAEGFSSSAPDMPMDLGYRMFTIYSKPCEGLGCPSSPRGGAGSSHAEVGAAFSATGRCLARL